MLVYTGKKNLEIDSKVMICIIMQVYTVETLEFDDILLSCRFMEIEKLEFDSTVVKLYY